MFVIFSIIFLPTIFIYFPLRVLNIHFISECYKSFTNPPIYLNVTHHFPNGPIYFTSEFFYERYSKLPDYEPEKEWAQYNFKKIDKLCNTSILFTMMGEDIEKLHIEIKLHVFNNVAPIAYINYNFYKGFKPGNYNLMNTINSFSVNMPIIELEDNYLTSRIKLFYKETEYLKSISAGNGELCLFCFYNNTIILKPKYSFGIPSGLIFAIKIDIIKNITTIESIFYAVFECKMLKNYKKEPVIFIKESKNYEINYKVLYKKYVDGELRTYQSRFEITHPKYEYADNFKNISPKYKIIFLMKLNIEYKICLDGSKSIVINFLKDKRFAAGVNKYVNISYGVGYDGYFPRKSVDPCDE